MLLRLLQVGRLPLVCASENQPRSFLQVHSLLGSYLLQQPQISHTVRFHEMLSLFFTCLHLECSPMFSSVLWSKVGLQLVCSSLWTFTLCCLFENISVTVITLQCTFCFFDVSALVWTERQRSQCRNITRPVLMGSRPRGDDHIESISEAVSQLGQVLTSLEELAETIHFRF